MVLVWTRIGAVGAALSLLFLLSGCMEPRVEYVPYVVLDNGRLLHGNEENYTGSKQVLEFCTGFTEPLYTGELNFYHGTLYGLSNYRELLLNNGFEETTVTKTSDLLDSTLSNGSDRVRLIYQNTGTIRIVFENRSGAAHILLEGMQSGY